MSLRVRFYHNRYGFLSRSSSRPIMRRSPEALERDKHLERLVARANAVSDSDTQAPSALFEDFGHAQGRLPGAQRQHSGNLSVFKRPMKFEPDALHPDAPKYDLLVRKISAVHRKRNALYLDQFLRRLFTAISQAGVDGALAPREIVLPDPVSFRRLSFNPDGTGLILDSPERAWFEELYQLLDGADLSRVRECTSCKRLFWARRRDQVGCSKRCANRARFSRFYKKAKEGQNVKRRLR
jgi:hypothetical protein